MNISDALSDFRSRNPDAQIAVEDGIVQIDKLWDGAALKLRIPASDTGFLNDLNHIWCHPQFDAIIHTDSNTAEVIYTYLDPEDEDDIPFLDRTFNLYFQGISVTCAFAVPTDRFLRFASYAEWTPTFSPSSPVSQLEMFTDAQKTDLPKRLQKYFDKKVPRSFHITVDQDIASVDLARLFRHINFLMRYYDRETPVIVVRNGEKSKTRNESTPLRYLEGRFPNNLTCDGVNEILLRLLDVASESSPRFAIIYYYQVFEYAGHYYLDEKAKTTLRRILRNPALVSCTDEQVAEIFEILVDLGHNDEVKMKRVIEDSCDPRKIWKEIQPHHDFFCAESVFDGGFSLPALISKDTTEDAFCSMWMPRTYDCITKIRNCIVHARERRENKVILPTKENNHLLTFYRPVIQRMAEQIALAKPGF